jgi:phosphatidylglycerol:prolipoprotein diacylglycerol transferase
MAALGFIAALLVGILFAKKTPLMRDLDDLINFSLWLIFLGFLGARIFYVIQFWDEFRHQLLDIILIQRHTGFVWYGGMIASGLYILWFAWQRKLNLRELLDYLTPAVILGHAFGRIGCFLYGCCYGKVTEFKYGVHFPFDLEHLRHATQLYESGAYFLVFLLTVVIFYRKKLHGVVFGVGLLLHSLVRFSVEFIRENPTYLFNLSSAQWIALGMMGIALIVLGTRKLQ